MSNFKSLEGNPLTGGSTDSKLVKPNKILAGMIHTVWAFAEKKPQGIFIVSDLSNGMSSAAVAVNGVIYKLDSLPEDFAVFNVDQDKLSKLYGYLSEDSRSISKDLANSNIAPPRFVYTALNNVSGQRRSVFSYYGEADASSKSLLDNWVKILEDRGWATLPLS